MTSAARVAPDTARAPRASSGEPPASRSLRRAALGRASCRGAPGAAHRSSSFLIPDSPCAGIVLFRGLVWAAWVALARNRGDAAVLADGLAVHRVLQPLELGLQPVDPRHHRFQRRVFEIP